MQYGVYQRAKETGFLGAKKQNRFANRAKKQDPEEAGEPKLSKKANAAEENAEKPAAKPKKAAAASNGPQPQASAPLPEMNKMEGVEDPSTPNAMLRAAQDDDIATPSNPHLIVHMGAHHLFRLKKM